jgi:hypothetical protein
MLKQDKNFRLPKEVKRMMAFMSPKKATEFKKLMIQGIIIGSINPPKEKKKGKHRVVETEEE